VARRHTTTVGARGGAGIQALRPARARLITALGAVAALGAPIAYVALGGGRLATVGAVAGAFGLTLLVLGLVLRWPTTIPWSILLVGGGYLLAREGNSVVDGWAAAIGVLLLLAAELASWSIEHDARIEAEASLVRRRVATLTALIAAALLVNFMLLAAAGVSASSGVLLAAVGVAAAVAAVAVVLRLLHT
jgi:hypothetical protein